MFVVYEISPWKVSESRCTIFQLSGKVAHPVLDKDAVLATSKLAKIE